MKRTSWLLPIAVALVLLVASSTVHAQANQQAGNEPSLGAEQSGATGGESVAVATPSMIGDLIGSFAMRCISPMTLASSRAW